MNVHGRSLEGYLRPSPLCLDCGLLTVIDSDMVPDSWANYTPRIFCKRRL